VIRRSGPWARAPSVDRHYRPAGIFAAGPLTPAQQRLLAHVRDSEKLLVNVIDDLITFSRLEAGHITYDTRPVLACDVLQSAEGVIAPLATNRGVKLAISGCQADATIRADGDKVKQILVNLAANASSSRNETAPSDGLSRQADNGQLRRRRYRSGIPSDRLGDIFRAVRGFGALHDRCNGTGLGLAIGNEFATGMGSP
jgi:signal transduction histidine kinase